MGQCTHVLGILNVKGNHWIAYVIDFAEGAVLFGDSLSHCPDDLIIGAFLVWIKAVIGKDFCIKRLTIAAQHDGFLCSILVFNALKHYIQPNRFPLLSTAQSITLNQQQRLDKALLCHIKCVCSLNSFVCTMLTVQM